MTDLVSAPQPPAESMHRRSATRHLVHSVIATVILAMICTSSAVAQGTSRDRTQDVTLSVRDSTIAYVLRTLTSQAGLGLAFNTDDPLFTRRITVQFRATKVMDAIATTLKGTGLIATLAPNGETVIIRQSSDKSATQATETGDITGRVTDSATSQGISGVSVTVQGINRATVTGNTGDFTLAKVPTGTHTITYKLLGYTSVTRTVTVEKDKRLPVRIIMRQTASILSGVVTTATGAERRVEVGNDITVLRVDSIMQTAPISSVTDLLESRVPGMTIQRTSGTPGDPARIRLRGTSSIYQNNDPIIIIDGIRVYSQQSDDRNTNISGTAESPLSQRSYNTPSPLDRINPNSIETIEILKGPSASALYGSDAANGVIVVTTKRGQSGPPRWDVSAYSGHSYMPGSWPKTLYKWITPLQGGGPTTCIGYCGDARVDSMVWFQALNNPRLTALGTGSTLGSAVTISGGTPAITYSFTGSTDNKEGILKLPKVEEERYLRFRGEPAPGWMRHPDQYRVYGASAHVGIQLSPRVKLAVSSMMTNTAQHRTSMSSSLYGAINLLQRTYIDLSQLNETPILGNPYERVISEGLELTNALQLNVQPWPWLPVTATVGTNSSTTRNEMSIARGLVTGLESGGVWRGSTNVASGLTGNAYTTVPLMRRVSLAAGFNFDRGRTSDQSGAFWGIPDDISDPSTGLDSTRNIFARNSSDRKSFGWFLEPKLNIQSRFFVMPGFRLDNNGLAGRNAGLNGLPKINMSWVASEESFFPFKDLVNLFRVRTAFGVSGVQPMPGDLNRLYRRQDGNPLGGTEPLYGDMLSLQYLGNTRLKPERGVELEGGIDADLWNNRLNLIVTYYRKRRIDAIVDNNYAASVDSGGKIRMNVGNINNSGLELSAGVQLIERRMIGVHLDASYNRLRSKVVKLTDDGVSLQFNASSVLDAGTRYVVGYPVEGRWAVPIRSYADVDGDGWITIPEIVYGTEARYFGSTEPSSQTTLSPRVTLLGGRIAMNVLFSYVDGYLQTAEAGGLYGQRLGGSAYENNIVEGPDGYDRQAAWIGITRGSGGVLTNAGYMQTVNVLRLQSMSLNVNLGTNTARIIRARSASIALQGSNLALWTNYIGVDPNVNGVPGARGLADTGQQPQPREWRLRIMLGY